MKTRILAAAALLPLLLAVVLFLPAVYTGILFGCLAAIGSYELLWRTGLVKNIRLVIYSSVMALYIGISGCLHFSAIWNMLSIFLFTALLFSEMLAAHTQLPFQQIAVSIVGGILVPYLMTALGRIRAMDHGEFFVLIPFVLAFLSDTGAYFAGRAFGKHKLAPIISPNKTVEGVFGGVIGAVVGIIIYGFVLQYGFHFRVNYFGVILYGVLGSLAAVFGDLSFSVIKRQTGIKDYGNLIPGHGGSLDRFDSMTIVAPLTEILLILIPAAVL